MADQPRTAVALKAFFGDNVQPQSISPQDLRDLVDSVLSNADGIAATGTNQATAAALTTYKNVVGTVPVGAGVVPQYLMDFIVFNRGANALLVYPISGLQWEFQGVNIAVSIPPGGSAEFTVTSATQGYVR